MTLNTFVPKWYVRPSGSTGKLALEKLGLAGAAEVVVFEGAEANSAAETLLNCV